jgi:hypothetical protein
MSHSRTGARLFSCYTEDSQHEDYYVVKFRNQLGSRILCEFMAALLGRHLGLPIPLIAIVEISPRLIATIPCPETRELLAGDQGPHFGSQHKAGGYIQLPPGFSIPPALISQALDIFAFDMLIQNPDRSDKPGRGKPNLLFDGNQFLLFDHELAFSFIALIGTPPPPWELRGSPLVENHIFYNQLTRYAKNHEVSFERFLTQFMTVSNALLDEMVRAMPGSWHNTTNVGKIVSHLTNVRDNIQRFKRGLLEALA